MKLYTEEQIRESLNDNFNFGDRAIDFALSKLTPIELPSDEKVDLYSNAMYPDFVWEVEGAMIRKLAHSNGAKWVIEQIKQQCK